MKRHTQQEALLQIGEDGQEKIRQSKVLIVGVGALGSVVAEALCRAGVGHLTLLDFDIVEESNLQRQALYTTADIGTAKVDAAKQHLLAIDPEIEIITKNKALESTEDISEYDIIVEGTDTLQTRFLLNDLAGKAHKAVVYGMASGTSGRVLMSSINEACFSCVFKDKEANDTCDQGILGTVSHAVACMQATMAIRHIIGKPGKGMIAIDGWNMTTQTIATTQQKDCPRCNGTYAHIEKPFVMALCQGTQRIHARPSKPILLDIEHIKEEPIATYASAVRVRVGEGTALVHRHGLVEFDNVSEEEAQKFVAEILKKKK